MSCPLIYMQVHSMPIVLMVIHINISYVLERLLFKILVVNYILSDLSFNHSYGGCQWFQNF